TASIRLTLSPLRSRSLSVLITGSPAPTFVSKKKLVPNSRARLFSREYFSYSEEAAILLQAITEMLFERSLGYVSTTAGLAVTSTKTELRKFCSIIESVNAEMSVFSAIVRSPLYDLRSTPSFEITARRLFATPTTRRL